MSEKETAERNWWTCLSCGHKFLREPMDPACTPLCPEYDARETQPGRTGRTETVTWVDARSDDGWTEQESLDMRTAEITTLGHVVEETETVLCIASSVDSRTGQLSGIMFIPKPCILSREAVFGTPMPAPDRTHKKKRF